MNKAILLTLTLCVPLVLGHKSAAADVPTYDWFAWSASTDRSTASSYLSPLATISVFSSGAAVLGVNCGNMGFWNVPFTPAVAPAAFLGLNENGTWEITVDLSGMNGTGGLLVGIGNFAHGNSSYPGYRLTAFDRKKNVMPLGSITQVGSFDHTWGGDWGIFNDDIWLNPKNGNLEVVKVPGGNDSNSDVLLLSLPQGTGSLVISTLGPNLSGDTLCILAAIPILHISRSGSEVLVSWAAADTNLVFESTTSLTVPSWAEVTEPPMFSSGTAQARIPAQAGQAYYRLKLR